MTKRKEEALKNNPGISKLFEWNARTNKWIDAGKYRSTRRTKLSEGRSARESCVFDNIEDAKSFRSGKINKIDSGRHHRNASEQTGRIRFASLLEEWKSFHFMTVDYTTRQTYERKLKPLEFLDCFWVDEIVPKAIDALVRHWRADYPHRNTRIGFEKELDALKVVLNYYRRRIDPRFPMPVYREHYEAARIVRIAKKPVRSLRPDDLARFLRALRAQKNPAYHSIALTQFGLGLRIGEACGLHWAALDLENRVATIEQTIVWDHENWEPRIKLSPKNGRVRFLAIPDFLVQEFGRLKALGSSSTSLVFHDRGQPLIRKTIGKAYNRALAECEIDYVSGTHLIRKTSATQANRITGDFFAVSRNLGHSTVEETGKYVEELDEGKLKVARALDEVAKTALGFVGNLSMGSSGVHPYLAHCAPPSPNTSKNVV